MSPLGIYFGSKFISLVETKGKKVVKAVQIPLGTNQGLEVVENVPEEIRIVALIKDELRKSSIQASEATICLSGKDLIVRNFEMPSLPKDELSTAVSFEAKKYIPFKLEEMISTFQARPDKAHKSQILFVAIKKSVLDKYSSIMAQLNIKISSIEYSSFSIFRLLKVSGAKDSGLIGVVNVDFEEESEVNFSVLDNGFTLFSRDISVVPEPGAPETAAGIPDPMAMEKLKSELRLSLDFYNRKFPGRTVSKVFLVTQDGASSETQALIKDMSLNVQSIDLGKVADRNISSAFGLIRAYGCSLFKTIRIPLNINLLVAKKEKAGAITPGQVDIKNIDLVSFVKGLKIDIKFIVLAVFICIGAFIYGSLQNLPLKSEISNVVRSRPSVTGVSSGASYNELVQIESSFKQKIEPINKIFKRPYFTPVLDSLAKAIPEGLWLQEFSLGEDRGGSVSMDLRGSVYKQDSDEEMRLVNDFVNNLRADSRIAKYFPDISITSVDSSSSQDNIKITRFSISCKGSAPAKSSVGGRPSLKQMKNIEGEGF